MFPLQRLGAEVWAINTVQFSNHTGYGALDRRGFQRRPGSRAGRRRRGARRAGRCDAVLSGYVGDAAIGEAILDAVARVRAANPRALYCCDPVIGDDRDGVYVRPGIAEMLRDHVLPAADLATPNRFELDMLTGTVPHACAGQGRRAQRRGDAAPGWPALRAADQPAHRGPRPPTPPTCW